MTQYATRRAHARLTLDPSYTASFVHEGRTFPAMPMTSVSVSGCGLRLPEAVTVGMEPGQTLTRIHLEHPDLPDHPVEGVIIHLLAQRHGGSEGYVLMGVQFVDAPLAFQEAVGAYVSTRLAL